MTYHAPIVQPYDLARFADTRDSEAIIPELVFLLVEQSVPKASARRIPYGDAVNQPGLDGLVESGEGFDEYVPAGRSYWEIGTNADPQSKATEDFRSRTESTSPEERSGATFVFVTPRSASSGGWNEPSQRAWIAKRKDRGWKDIRIIDGVKLADWLRQFPALGQWMARRVGLSKTLGGITTAADHWQLLQHATSGEMALPSRLFIEGRENACEALQGLFQGKVQRLLLFAESTLDVPDFVSAYLTSRDVHVAREWQNRCLFINEEDAWRTVVQARSSHVLVADARLALDSDERAQLLALATSKGHAVVVPLCGAWSNADANILRLRSPSQSQIERVLIAAGFRSVVARELAAIGGDRLSALRRHFQGFGSLPVYATWETARLLALSALAGSWDGKASTDQSALELLLGKAYGEWIEILRNDALRSDSPLIQRDEKWRVVARGESWSALGGRVSDADLERFREVAVRVLSEADPKFELPKDQRFLATVRGQCLRHSHLLRDGIADTLALLGSRPDALSSCSPNYPESIAASVVRALLLDADWKVWASLDAVLPLLAEAAPTQFLDAVEAALKQLATSPFHQVFAQEGSGVDGWNYVSGLLWALETLAWSSDHLTRVAVLLADLASIDPGGNWANRPASSLREIFLPWHFQTSAPLPRRVTAIETVLREQPNVGWSTLLGLLPHSHSFSSGCRRPRWRNYIPRDWSDSVLVSEYWDQVEAFINLALSVATTKRERLPQLLERWSDLGGQARQSLIDHLGSARIGALPATDKAAIWETLTGILRKHGRHAGAAWALPAEELVQLEALTKTLEPAAPELKFRYLFSRRPIDLFEEIHDYREQIRLVDDKRRAATEALLMTGGPDAVLAFARSTAMPGDVGQALGNTPSADIDHRLLPTLLDSDDEAENRFIAGFVRGRCFVQGWDWVNNVLSSDWLPRQKSSLLTMLPFTEATWRQVTAHLGTSDEATYWERVEVNPYNPDPDLTFAITKLIEHGRPGAAIQCIAARAHKAFNPNLAIQALLAVIQQPELAKRLDASATTDLIKHLQNAPNVDQRTLQQIEWTFLPWLGEVHGVRATTLEHRLASDPEFFAHIVGLVFRSTKSENSKEAPNEEAKIRARYGYGLLADWNICPGTAKDGTFDADVFREWLQRMYILAEEGGHMAIAQDQLGRVLLKAPADPNGLWIHRAVAQALNERDAEHLRAAFCIALFNTRGIYPRTAGQEEQSLAAKYRAMADAAEGQTYSRFGAELRKLAAMYEQEAKREAADAQHGD